MKILKLFAAGMALAVLAILLCPAAPLFCADGGNPGSCLECHKNIGETLPSGHEEVTGTDITACLTCHVPKRDGKAEPDPFSAVLHQSHAVSGVKADCKVCHTVSAEKGFGLYGQPEALGVPDQQTLPVLEEITNLWAESAFLDHMHATRSVTCSGCHGEKLPALEDKPANDRCLACHGSYEQLAAKTPGADFPDRNPHKSHLGDINCTVCHKAHQASVNYCLECHGLFKMNPIPGAAAGN